MPDLTTLGEGLLRLPHPPGDDPAALPPNIFVGGAEANVARALAALGMKTAWFSRLPESDPGRRIADDLARHGVDITHVIRSREGKVGRYFDDPSAPRTGAGTVYDRTGSTMATLSPAEIDWDALLDTKLLHLTGITPALSDGCRKAIAQAVLRAAEKKVPVSFDVNYRRQLWPSEQAAATLAPLLAQADVVIMTSNDARELFGGAGDDEAVLSQMHKRFGARVTALTLDARGAIAREGHAIYRAPGYAVEVVDRVGGGDAFAAGLLYGVINNDIALGLRYGTAMSALKLGVRGDCLTTDHETIRRLLADNK